MKKMHVTKRIKVIMANMSYLLGIGMVSASAAMMTSNTEVMFNFPVLFLSLGISIVVSAFAWLLSE